MYNNEELCNDWVNEMLTENKFKELPTREAYEKRRKVILCETFIFFLRNHNVFSGKQSAGLYSITFSYPSFIKETELMEKYSREVTAEEILDMYEDPVKYFSDLERKVSENYKCQAFSNLKRCFRHVGSNAITKQLQHSNGLYYPAFKVLRAKMSDFSKRGKHSSMFRKTKRPDSDCGMVVAPNEMDLNLAKVNK